MKSCPLVRGIYSTKEISICKEFTLHTCRRPETIENAPTQICLSNLAFVDGAFPAICSYLSPFSPSFRKGGHLSLVFKLFLLDVIWRFTHSSGFSLRFIAGIYFNRTCLVVVSLSFVMGNSS
jgi:hypothetical protein